MVAELVEKAKIRSTNGSLRNPFMNKIYQFILKTFGNQPKWSNSLINTKNQLRCYGNHHSCYGLRRTFGSVTTKIYDSCLSKNVYKTEIDKVEEKLWRFTLGKLILGHPVYLNFSVYSKFRLWKIPFFSSNISYVIRKRPKFRFGKNFAELFVIQFHAHLQYTGIKRTGYAILCNKSFSQSQQNSTIHISTTKFYVVKLSACCGEGFYIPPFF